MRKILVLAVSLMLLVPSVASASFSVSDVGGGWQEVTETLPDNTQLKYTCKKREWEMGVTASIWDCDFEQRAFIIECQSTFVQDFDNSNNSYYAWECTTWTYSSSTVVAPAVAASAARLKASVIERGGSQYLPGFGEPPPNWVYSQWTTPNYIPNTNATQQQQEGWFC